MVYRLFMLSDENDFFRREIKIDSEATFLELNNHILSTVGYSQSEMTTFYLCDEDWNKEQEITLMDMGMGAEYDSYLMESTRLEELLEDKGQHLLFVFDMLSERGFFIELVELIPCQSLEAPITTISEGHAPEQTSSLEFAETRSVGGGTAGGGLDDELFSEEGIDLDELDPEGFEGLDMPDASDLY